MTNMYDVIIPAAGMGKRMQADKNKILLQLHSKSILEYTLETFQSDDNCRAIHLAGQKDELEMLKAMSLTYNKIEVVTAGGAKGSIASITFSKLFSRASMCLYMMQRDLLLHKKHCIGYIQKSNKIKALLPLLK